ncbi:hypothetical protein QNH36_21880 [Mesobacillus sp. AQ2]|uniref:hypothetical protein n=1 Tax=Mesobacillus sp. AQ2 TaxID=3043332 RepID=UPI0024C17F2E|nr:hypothetical protein [Mesobacillus sp. AQ2]WHX40263.1 hypothetical protein QNH36_21880 [Mesobacillus sp. AQ2]
MEKMFLKLKDLFTFTVELYKDSNKIKAFLPGVLILLLFQDLIVINLGLLNETAGKLLNNLDEVLILLGLPLAILHYFERNWKFDFLLSSLIIIFLLGSISSLINLVPLNVAIQGAILMLKGFLVLFIFRSISFSSEDIHDFTRLFKKITVIVLIFAVIDLILYEPFRGLINTDHKFDYRIGIISIQSIFTHPSIYGWFLAIVGMYLLSVYTVKKEKRAGLLSATVFFASFFSFRFKTVIAIVFNTLFAVLHLKFGLKSIKNLRTKKSFIPLMAVSAVLLLAIIYAVVQLSLLTIDRYISIDYKESARKALYIFGFVIAWKEFPFGVGFGRYGSWTAREHYSPVYVDYGLDKIYGLYSTDPKWATDTYWPSIMGEIGIIGALVLASIFIYIILLLYKGFRVIQDSDSKIFLLFTIMILNQSLIESLGEQVYNSGPQYFFIFAFTGIALSIISSNNISLDLNISHKIKNLRTSLRIKKDEE